MTQQDRDEIRQIVREELDKGIPMTNAGCDHYWDPRSGTSSFTKCLKCGARLRLSPMVITGGLTPHT